MGRDRAWWVVRVTACLRRAGTGSQQATIAYGESHVGYFALLGAVPRMVPRMVTGKHGGRFCRAAGGTDP